MDNDEKEMGDVGKGMDGLHKVIAIGKVKWPDIGDKWKTWVDKHAFIINKNVFFLRKILDRF